MERRLAAVALASGVCCAGLSTAVESWAAISAALATTIVIAGALQRAGWLGSARRIVRIIWRADGRWLLEQGNGDALAGELSADTRAGSWGVWLRWRIGAGFGATRVILLTRGDVAAGDLRRLAVRLRTARLRT